MAYTVRKDWFDWLDNTIVGNSLDEEIIGGGGNDKLVGNFGDDWIRGDDGNDKLFGGDGDDVLQGGADDDQLFGGEGHDSMSGGSGNDTLFFSGDDDYSGGTGTDTFIGRALDFIDVESGGAHNLTVFSSPFAAGLRISIENGVAELRDPALEGPNSDLRTAFFENHYSDEIPAFTVGTGNATFSSIERYELTELGDYFEGDDTADTILGLGGDDVIEGKGGGDIIKGGQGSDTVEYGSQGLEATGQPNDPSNDVGVNVDLERGTGLIGDAQGDTYESIENIRGSSFIDALYGSDGANSILARGGNDFVEGRGGADSLNGGTGIDEAMYASSGSSIDVNLTRASQLGGDAQGDRLTNFENVSGTAFGDRLTGDSGSNKLSGLGGSDTIDGGHGNDILIGGDGVSTDTVSFESWDFTLSVTTPARISLGEPSGVGGATLAFRQLVANFQFTTVLETDQLIGFENVRGSNLHEIITGNGKNNVLEGRGGNDTIDGGGGNDTIVGGSGVDTLIGGGDSDTFKFLSASDMPITGYIAGNIDSIRDFQDSGLAQDVIDLSALRTFTGGRLFFNDGDANSYELGEVMVFASAARGTEITADLDGDGNLDFALRLDQVITTLDSGDFIF